MQEVANPALVVEEKIVPCCHVYPRANICGDCKRKLEQGLFDATLAGIRAQALPPNAKFNWKLSHMTSDKQSRFAPWIAVRDGIIYAQARSHEECYERAKRVSRHLKHDGLKDVIFILNPLGNYSRDYSTLPLKVDMYGARQLKHEIRILSIKKKLLDDKIEKRRKKLDRLVKEEQVSYLLRLSEDKPESLLYSSVLQQWVDAEGKTFYRSRDRKFVKDISNQYATVLPERAPSTDSGSSNGRTLVSETSDGSSSLSPEAKLNAIRLFMDRWLHQHLFYIWVVKQPLYDQAWFNAFIELNRSLYWIKKIMKIMRRDGSDCNYCDKEMSPALMTLDHVVPKAYGGSDRLDNLVIACYDCNHRRGAPEEYKRGMHVRIKARRTAVYDIVQHEDDYAIEKEIFADFKKHLKSMTQ